MRVTVREAMRIGGLVKCKVVAGEAGLDRCIDHITVMEVPDVIQWLKGNDFLLTSLYPIKDDPDAIQNLVQQLNAVGSSALAIKTHRYVKEIPKEIIEAGNRLRLPIIEIHKDVSYLDIMTPLMEIMLHKTDSGQEKLEGFFQWMTELALGGKGIPALIDALQQVAENYITIESETSLLEFGGNKPISPLSRMQKNELKAAKRSIRMERPIDHGMTPCIITPLLLNDELYGYVTCWQTKREFLQQDFNMLDRCVPLIALEFLKVITKMEVEQTYKDDFLSEILTGNVKDPGEIVEKGKMFGWDLNQRYQVLAIAFQQASPPNDERKQDTVWQQEWRRRQLRKVGDMFRFHDEPVLVTARKELIIVLYPRKDTVSSRELPYRHDPQKEPMLLLAESIRAKLSEEVGDLDCIVGIGRFYPDLNGIHRGYSEAVQAIRLGKPISGESGVVHYEDLGLFRLLGQHQDRSELKQLCSETVGKLADYDGSSNANLVATLTEYFSNNCALAETADKMFVHVNTMKYRLQKIEQLTGCSVHNAEHRLLLHVGLKIYQLLQADRL